MPKPTGSLKFFKNYFGSIDYAVGGVGLRGNGDTSGYATGTIHMSGVPADADILSAHLYWQTMESTPEPNPYAAIGMFRGGLIMGKQVAPDGAPSCWGSGGGHGTTQGGQMLRTYRADVLALLPFKKDAVSGKPIGQRLVNDSDLTPDVGGLTQIKLLDSGGGPQSPTTGNQVTHTNGASLIVIYRAPSLPMRSVVIYEGGLTANLDAPIQTIPMQGFYQARALAANDPLRPTGARITPLVGDGDANFGETVSVLDVDGNFVTMNPFTSSLGQSWDNPTYNVGAYINQDQAAVSLKVEPSGQSIDCLSFTGVVFSTLVQDTDFDGLLDIWETTSGLQDPNNQPLPDLPHMGANPNVQDIFIELGFMSTAGYSTDQAGVVPLHTHLPSKTVLDGVGALFHSADPRKNPADPTQTISTPINVHFDVGDRYQTTPADPYIIPAAYARGGEEILETPCVSTPTDPCHFPGFATTGWKSGFHFLRDQPLNYPDEGMCAAAGPLCQRRFDPNRSQTFKYVLLAHLLGFPKAEINDPATPIDETKTPKGVSGVSDGHDGGGDFMVTLGAFDNSVGTEFVQTAVLSHELGHTVGLRHGGSANKYAAPSPNCKPGYVSVMNYLFAIRGLIGTNGPVLDFSRQQLGSLNESSLTEGPLAGAMYPTRWLAPLSGSFLDGVIGTTAATRHCNGSPLHKNPSDPLYNPADAIDMVRVDGTYSSVSPTSSSVPSTGMLTASSLRHHRLRKTSISAARLVIQQKTASSKDSMTGSTWTCARSPAAEI